MPSSYPPLLDTATVCELVGTTSYTRGRAYARKRSVSNVTWDGATLKLAGKVQGHRASPYLTAVLFSAAKTSPRPDADLHPSSGSCSCPMGYACKHVAALLLTSNAGFTRAAPEGTSMEPLFAEPARMPPRVLTPPPRPAPEPDPLWTKQLDSLLTPARQPGFTGGYRAGRPAPEVPIPLGVQFELREVANQQFDQQRTRNALMQDGQDEKKVLLTVRPVKQNAKGKWLVGNLRWDAFRDTTATATATAPRQSRTATRSTFNGCGPLWRCTIPEGRTRRGMLGSIWISSTVRCSGACSPRVPLPASSSSAPRPEASSSFMTRFPFRWTCGQKMTPGSCFHTPKPAENR
ncbi:SWIM zinc finger family protein [Paeniglutamicibacter antarcticus]|uniref:SWIM zinc finger family protein n=1 Tax=Arthrobacter terrae TaxID=2935737 RepID=A0A931G4K6_9MICC|nr:SWIM zinc finger family protein [Arthrobacter terrae]MBG0738520.1 SWIM zinc finger family protein [Arthrobacter terrae]